MGSFVDWLTMHLANLFVHLSGATTGVSEMIMYDWGQYHTVYCTLLGIIVLTCLGGFVKGATSAGFWGKKRRS